MVRGAGSRRGAAGGRGGREADPLPVVPLPLSPCHVDPAPHGSGLTPEAQRQASLVRGSGGDHVGIGGKSADGAAVLPGAQGGAINQVWYERSHERFTWKGVLRPNADYMKRTKIVPKARRRQKKVRGSCVYYSIATALQAANRACGVEVGELPWQDLYEMVDEDNPCRISAALRVLKYRGIRSKADYEKRKLNGQRYKISQFCEFCNVDIIDDNVVSGLDRHNMKAAIDNMLSKSVILAYFPVSSSYREYDGEHIYAYDADSAVVEESDVGLGRICTHVVVVTGFGFEEKIPYFEFLDCNGKEFGKKGFGRILSSSIISLFALDVIVD